MSAAIEARALCYAYEDGTAALEQVSLAGTRGKITGILGANGAGKSTLFLNLNGVLTPKSGQVLLDGVPVRYDKKGLAELRRRVGIVFQDPDDQLFSADVYRDVSFGAVNLGLPEEEVRCRVEDALERTGIAQLRDRPTHALSFGQKKRAAIAGVLVMQPEVLILDEPTAGLDPQGVSGIMDLLAVLRDSLGMTVLVATHDMDIVPLYCDDTYLLGGGRVLAHGTPAELFAQPAVLRENHLRLPRIAHLMEILGQVDGLDADRSAATIGAARREILRLLKQEERDMNRGKLYGVGMGPGDPELITCKAQRVIAQSPVLAVPDTGGEKTALKIAGPLAQGKQVLYCPAPMVRDEAALDAVYESNAELVCARLEQGEDVAFLTLGDPTVYSTYLYLHRKVVARGYEAEIIPGVPSFCAVAARLGQALCEKSERLLIVPASHGDVEDCLELDANLVFMKAGREIGALKNTLAQRGLLNRASMVANCGMEGERVYPRFADLEEGSGYFSVVLVKKGEEA